MARYVVDQESHYGTFHYFRPTSHFLMELLLCAVYGYSLRLYHSGPVCAEKLKARRGNLPKCVSRYGAEQECSWCLLGSLGEVGGLVERCVSLL